MKQAYVVSAVILVVISCLVSGIIGQYAANPCPLVKQTATYRLTFTGEFTAQSALSSYGPFSNGTVPVGPGSSSPIANSAFPFGDQSISCNQSFFGNLIGATHNNVDTSYLWENAGHSTPAFAAYVDGSYTGSRLRNYINNGINKGVFNSLIYVPEIIPFNGTESVEFDVNYTSPFVDVVLSIVPSPDWFVGVSKLPLFEQGHWYRYVAIDLYAWDAGTRDGSDFYSTATTSSPQGRVTSLRNRYPFLSYQNPIGVLIFERVDSDTCIQEGVTFYSDALTDFVTLTTGESSCSKPIPYTLGTPAGVAPSDCYDAGIASSSSS